MMRTWKLLGLSAVVAVVLTAAPVRAGGEGKPSVEDRLKAIEDKLGEMNRAIAKAFGAIETDMKAIKQEVKTNDTDAQLKLTAVLDRVGALEKQLTNLRTQVQTMRDRVATVANYPPTDKSTLDEIKMRLSQLQDALNRLQSTSERKAFSLPDTGRLVLLNLYGEDLLFVVNQRSYRLAPGASVTLDQPAGAFTYEVISPTHGLVRRNTPVLRAGETFPITAR
jgi:hypothetical protein